MKYSITFFLVSLLFLCACEEEEISKKTQPLSDGVMRLSATVSNGAKTRALNDPLGDATADEKRVDRIAFFVYTQAEGMQIYVPAAVGESYDDFPNKVHLTDNGDGSYGAKVDLTAGAGYDADVIAVANLPEAYDYTQIVSWKGLLDSVTVATTAMPLCTGEYDTGKKNAFVMFASATVALHKEKEAAVNFAMERLVARIDITNKAYGTGKNAFKLTKARILQAKPASYITPHDLYASPEVVTVNDWELDPAAVKFYTGEVKTDNETTEAAGDATCQAVWHTLYTYENDDVAHTPTCLEVTGEMNGATITRKIPFEVTDADGITKNPVSIVRNHRYLVQINPAPGETDITYKLTVDEWNAVDTVNVQPNQDAVPVVTNVVCAEATKSYGGDLVGGVMPDSIVVPAIGGTLTFTASCPFDTRVTTDYFSPEDGNSWLEITSRSEATVTKGDISLAREYTITIKESVGLDQTQVNRGYLYISNGGNGSIVDTVVVYQGVDIAYADTRFASVTMGQVSGKDVVWAPIDLGATEIATKVLKDADITEEEKIVRDRQCGYNFQWGRKVPFVYGKEGITAPAGIALASYADATKADYQYADKFIPNTNAWFSDYASFNKSWPKENDPCPAGWRIPTKEELQIVFDQMTVDNTTVDGTWTSATSPAFVLPFGGNRASATGIAAQRGELGGYWSSTFEGGKAYRLNSYPLWGTQVLSSGYNIRCVKE